MVLLYHCAMPFLSPLRSLRLTAAILLVSSLVGGPAAAEPLALESDTKPLNAEGDPLEGIGALRFRGALSLSAPDARFGGLSGLTVSPDGAGLVAITDEGHWVRARIAYDDRGWLAGLHDAEIGPLAGLSPKRLKNKYFHDSESLARLPDGGLLVSFERYHRFWHYPNGAFPLSQAPSEWPAPAALSNLGDNEGIEALTGLGDGRLLAIAEGADDGADQVPAYLWDGTGWQNLSYARHQDYRPCGATLLPDGDLLVLERRFSFLSGMAIRVRRVARADIVPGAVLEGRLLGELRAPLLVDNLEAVDARRGPGGETLIYLLSDDNFNALQRNLLMMFAL